MHFTNTSNLITETFIGFKTTLKDILTCVPIAWIYILLFVSLLILEYFNFHLSPDISQQLASLKNFADGHGISISRLDDNNQVVYQPLSLWPAGLILFLTPFYLITKSTVLSAILLKLTANIFFILFLSKYLEYLQLKEYKNKLIVFFFSFAVAPFIHFYPSDTIATVLCLWGFYFNLQYFDSGKYIELFSGLLFLSLSYFVKYSFLPFLLYPCASFILNEGWRVFKSWKKFLIIFFFSLVAIIIIYRLNDILLGKSNLATGWDAFNGNPHWIQLSKFDGFMFTFGNYEWAFENLFKNHLGIFFEFNWISILVTIYFYIFFLIAFYRKGSAQNPKFLQSINISLSAGVLISFFLALLTVNNPGQTWVSPYWTFVEESRYFAPIIIVGLINILMISFTKKKLSFLHFVIATMFALNLFAYNFIIKNGSWGRNFMSFTHTEKSIRKLMPTNEDKRVPIFLIEDSSKNSEAYYYLLSQGSLLVDKSKYMGLKSDNHLVKAYLLKSDGHGSFLISPID